MPEIKGKGGVSQGNNMTGLCKRNKKGNQRTHKADTIATQMPR